MTKRILNAAQKQAVEYVSGPLIIVAGAGTGKTTVVTQKIKYLLDKKLAKPEEILALTFNEKAAAEMQNRLDEDLDIGYADLQISTFHAFCQKLLEWHGLDIGLSTNFKIITPTDAWLLIHNNLDKFNLDYYRPMGNPTKHIHELIKHFSKCKDEMISPENYLEYAENLKLDKDQVNIDEKNRLSEIADAYHIYNQLLLENNALDFGDLIFYSNLLLEKRPQILKLLQNRFKFILVDEFQDVNWAQYSLIRQLSAAGAQLSVVGDDDQSIYAFRGASVSNILRFKDDFFDAKEIILTENYRSGQNILDTSYKLIKNNDPDRLETKLKINKRLISKFKDLKSEVIHIHSATADEEAESVTKEIIKIKKTDKKSVWDDFAILVRANSHAELFINALENHGIPYEFLAAAGLYCQPIVVDCINFFKILDNYHESKSVYRLIRMPVFNFKESDIQKLTYFAKQKSLPLFEVLKRAAEIEVSQEGVVNCDKLVNLINDGAKQAQNEKPTAVLYSFLDKSGYLKFLTQGEDHGERKIIRQIYQLKQFFEYIAKYESITPSARIFEFLEHFNNIIESGELGIMKQPSDNPDSVNIMTVHTAKGLEFKYVFMVNLVEERFPTRSRGNGIEVPEKLIKEQLPEGDSHYQEERRLFYVAMTRAKEKLYLTGADDYGGLRNKKISRFLNEIDFSAAIAKTEKKSKKILKNSIGEKIEDNKGQFVYELPKAFSFSQIKAYDTCPYQYKLSNIIKLPTEGSPSFSFGQSMHLVFQKFYIRIRELNSVQQDSLFGEPSKTNINLSNVKVPSLDELLKIYEENWIGDWYKNKKQREDYFSKGKEILREFYKTHENKWTVPIALESWFKIKIGPYLLHGRIDRVDKMSDGRLEIIDYKTGKSKETVTGEDKNQLLIYQIALKQLPEFSELGESGQLTYYYLNDNTKISFLGNDKEIAKLTEKITAIIDRIQSLNFKPTPEKHTCDYCDFKNICEYRA
ncbi:MAG: hypothetical protein COU29_00265 [Candidatus Magasanikbacteria bacterium CG10_big_fil_rev_8_21_14_0_10_36_32]|uniref:DNA 3'-5' helicase n=1 Tax=Candidatus Magasanikbacteria bacterium CG10_big_fil_rev_8_21_14_0_10_36_32 TaxID=1974646 RepID=A0A2M6W7Q3_9BACT|nr:MAG: hypothetical protein COU29_00265 [Candidatus Magasanikbacteria bacterium CG10_big_fil_rev_8_21_14_0_10_36_32]